MNTLETSEKIKQHKTTKDLSKRFQRKNCTQVGSEQPTNWAVQITSTNLGKLKLSDDQVNYIPISSSLFTAKKTSILTYSSLLPDRGGQACAWLDIACRCWSDGTYPDTVFLLYIPTKYGEWNIIQMFDSEIKVHYYGLHMNWLYWDSNNSLYPLIFGM